jgi:inner membrane protein
MLLGMEPITHLMTGACLARAGFNRKAAYATAAMVIAAELPDIDTLWGVDGPVAAFQHHRGWTHTFLGLPIEAAAVVGVAWLWHWWRHRRPQGGEAVAERNADSQPLGLKENAAPVRWGLLYGFVLVALLSHLALDWTNNYGLRPFFPFNPQWYAGSFVFIFEPVLFGMLLVALLAPSLFGLIGGEIGARRARFRGRGWAIAALVGMSGLWCWRWVEKEKALAVVEQQDFGAQVLRASVSPHPITPYKWHAVVETPMYYQLATIDSLRETVQADSGDTLYKPPTTMATLVAKRSWLGEVYLDWSQYPVVEEMPKSADDPGLTTVTFRDLRFMYDVPFLKGRGGAALEGQVMVNGDRKVMGMEMDGHEQR